MNKQYFNDFEWLVEAKNAKSLSYYSSMVNASFPKKLYDEFENLLKEKEDRFRISLHMNSEDDLHNMIIAMKKETFVYPHKHQKSESYHLMKGKIWLIYFTEDGKINKCVELEKDKNLIARVDKNVYHAIISVEDSIYHETRIGPFIVHEDSVFANWIVQDKEKYMQELVKKISEY